MGIQYAAILLFPATFYSCSSTGNYLQSHRDLQPRALRWLSALRRSTEQPCIIYCLFMNRRVWTCIYYIACDTTCACRADEIVFFRPCRLSSQRSTSSHIQTAPVTWTCRSSGVELKWSGQHHTHTHTHRNEYMHAQTEAICLPITFLRDSWTSMIREQKVFLCCLLQ